MQKLNLSTRPLAVAALSLAIAGALVAPQAAHASAFQLKENSAKALGRAFAGSTAAGDDASVIVNNPAAMSMLKGNVFQADVTGINFSTKFHGTATDAQGRPISGGNGGEAGTTIPVPAMYFATQVSDRVHLGLGLTAPFGFKTEYDSDWKGRYNGIKSDFKSFDVTLSASFDVTDDFAVGVSAIAQKTSAGTDQRDQLQHRRPGSDPARRGCRPAVPGRRPCARRPVRRGRAAGQRWLRQDQG